ncbi:hypothetical protein F5888DRAFT_248189 [Russula emetica]|nr:hypothetical protein F5888DRAFT_945923 [Russula emetica]KAF8497733.1 hypothetical protein F5888DRAFT_248189 [Russula emetica]
MIGTESDLSVQTAAMKVIDQLDKADAPLIPEAYIYLLGLQYLVSLSDGLAGYTFPLYTRSRSRNHPRIQPSPCVRRAHSTLHCCPKPSQPWAANCAHDGERRPARASCGPLLPPCHEPLRLHFRRCAADELQGASHCPPHLMRSSLPPRVVATLDEPLPLSHLRDSYTV